MYKTLTVSIEGIKPLMVHNVQLADPLNPVVKQIKAYSGKRKKTDEDIEVLAQLEWVGSLYVSEPFQRIEAVGNTVHVEGGGHCILPAVGMEAAVVSAAKKLKLGTTVKAGVMIQDDVAIRFDGDKLSINELLKRGKNFDTRAVTVNRAKIMRTRPVFYNWSLNFELEFLPDVITKQQIKDILAIGGKTVGLFEYRPRFGTYKAEVN